MPHLERPKADEEDDDDTDEGGAEDFGADMAEGPAGGLPASVAMAVAMAVAADSAAGSPRRSVPSLAVRLPALPPPQEQLELVPPEGSPRGLRIGPCASPARSPRQPGGDGGGGPSGGSKPLASLFGGSIIRSGSGGTTPRPPRSVHTVDWSTLQAIRAELCRRSAAQAAAAQAVAIAEGTTRSFAACGAAAERERPMTAEELVRCWLDVAECEQLRQGHDPLSGRDREFVEIRVAQSMREVDPQCSGQVDIDIWVHHMLLTRSSPGAMRAMLQINRLLEVAIGVCPGILVGLQHAFEVARDAAVAKAWQGGTPPREDRDVEQSSSGSRSSACLPFSEVVGIFGRKLWHLRPGTKECPAKRKTDFAYRTPDEFIASTVKALDLDAGSCVSSSDFLALCLGRREWEVTLHLYDLSHGLARAVSPWILPEMLEGVWHTGLVVYGKEYYFGGDIYYDTPGETGFGTPRVAISMGTTLRQRDELHAFVVDELKPIFTREAYDAARNNCNHFTDRVSMYLLGKHIPEEVLRQPEIMLQTNLGRTLRPILTRVLGQYFVPKETSEEISINGVSFGPRSTYAKADFEAASETRSEALWDATFAL
mmetsp:Transcript_104122/g.299309  ORF Transcript_104122/g.299309 Transcript_104122/m.299309 type:complete len:597 (-) Transcript_104122:101-1891(-)